MGIFTFSISHLDSHIKTIIFDQSKVWQKTDSFHSLLQLLPNFASKQFTVLKTSEKIVTKESILSQFKVIQQQK